MKNYVLDTNVLLHDPSAMLHFEDNNVLIPIEVIEEIDNFKRESNELGRNARTVSRTLDGLRTKGRLSEGVGLENGGRLRILMREKVNGNGHGPVFVDNKVDSMIVEQALIVKKGSDLRTVLVTKDINLRLKADAVGLPAEDYETDRVPEREVYTGTFEMSVTSELMDLFHKERSLELPKDDRYFACEYCTLVDEADPKHTILTRVSDEGTHLQPIIDSQQGVWGIKPRNREQRFALDALLDDKIKLVSLMGIAGTGKTLLALATGLKRVVTDRSFRRILVARPTISMGKELGFLPGTMEEKLNPWMQPIHDALEMLTDLNMGNDQRRTADLLRNGTVVIEALSYIRGRSIANQYMIIDEAQNLTPLEVKTIVTRAGAGTKIILTGDPYQIDNPYVDTLSNGLTYLVNRFKDQSIAAHVELVKGERSELAELAAKLL